MYRVIFYEDGYEAVWDEFVLREDCVNGTFLQSRRFLNYHPQGRFIDASVIVLDDKDRLVAVCPACTSYEGDKKILFSHKGSTFGGLIVSRKNYKTDKLLKIIEAFDKFILDNGYHKIILKLTSNLFSNNETELLEYLFTYKGYKQYTELSTYIDFSSYKENIIANLEQGKRTHVNNCKKAGLVFKKLELDRDIEKFYDVLCENLSKFDTKPIHTLEELLEFKNKRLVDECEFHGVFLEEELVAGGMIFKFKQAKVLHAQYLAAKFSFNKLSPVTFLYYSLILYAKEIGAEKLSWGISTENCGKEINMGLIKSKESYNGRYSLNRTFYKEY